MVVCSSEDLIHALTCSYSMHQIEEERQDASAAGLDSNQEEEEAVILDDYDHEDKEQQQGPRHVPSTNTSSSTSTSISPQSFQLRPTNDLSSESTARSTRTRIRISNKHYKNDYLHCRENQNHYRNPNHHSPTRRLIPQTILEDASLEDLVLESKDWLLKSLLDLDESKSGDP